LDEHEAQLIHCDFLPRKMNNRSYPQRWIGVSTRCGAPPRQITSPQTSGSLMRAMAGSAAIRRRFKIAEARERVSVDETGAPAVKTGDTTAVDACVCHPAAHLPSLETISEDAGYPLVLAGSLILTVKYDGPSCLDHPGQSPSHGESPRGYNRAAR
jgi:hypothetical protein